MRTFYALLFIAFTTLSFGQTEIQEITWDELTIESFSTKENKETGEAYSEPKFTKKQKALDGQEVILKGNFHVLNNFGAKSFMLSRDEIIKTPMQGDEVIRLMMEEDPEIYFGRTAKIKGVLHIDEDPNAETIYYITEVKKVKNTGTIVGE